MPRSSNVLFVESKVWPRSQNRLMSATPVADDEIARRAVYILERYGVLLEEAIFG
jgi:hypothetical protein